jgi:cytochrome c biogenesis protein CcdA/thiol-disulfide isomerase/thioredoxin
MAAVALLIFAFIAGLATALAPCILPALPLVLGGGMGGGRRRPIGIGAGLIATFVLATLGLTAALDSLGLSASTLRNIAIVGLLAFGLVLALPWIDRRLGTALSPATRLAERLPRDGEGLRGGLLLGGALGLAWTPCAGPILAGLTAAVATTGAGADTALALTAYATGAALPIAALAWGGGRLSRRLGPYSGAFRQAMGALMVVAAVIMLAGLDVRLTAAALADVPGYESTIQRLERNDAARDAVARLQDQPEGPSRLEAAENDESTAATAAAAELPNAGPAPELAEISDWFNSEPLTLAELRGKVVLVDFWTYSCVNCVRTLPHLRAWHDEYADDGLVILGVHTPEFAFEADPGNVGDAVDDLGIEYPVALDPDYGTWTAYQNRFWPAKYLVDRNGDVRYAHFGEGAYSETENLIRLLLGEEETAQTRSAAIPDERDTTVVHGDGQTPESYLGYQRIDRLGAPEQLVRDEPADYAPPFRLPQDHLALGGRMVVTAEYTEAVADGSIHINFEARDVFLVLEKSGASGGVEVLLDGKPVPATSTGDDVRAGRVVVGDSRLYSLLRLPERGRHRLELKLDPGVRAFAFTFG